MERIVNRSELDSGGSSPFCSSASSNVKGLIPFEFIEQAAPDIEQNVEDEDEMDFCLFAPAPGQLKNEQSVSRIRLKSPTPLNAEPGLENPHRDRSYYFTNRLGPEELQRMNSAAVSGQDIRARSCGLCPGSSYPWKVVHTRATRAEALALAKATATYGDFAQQPSNRKRPGKQARIKSRKNQVLAKAAQEQDQKVAELKEAADREKRTRRNREKKAKKKIREKAKKAAGTAGAAESEAEDVDDETSSQPG